MNEIKPSIGIEIELPWKTMLHRINPVATEILNNRKSYWSTDGEERLILQKALDALDEMYKPKIAAAHMAGIGKGDDGYAEFALRPHFETQTTINQVKYLYDNDLLRDGERYPLHITLGGFAVSRASGQLMFGMEIVGGVRPERILQERTWNRKGTSGTLNRQERELALGQTRGVEFRTLELLSLAQLSDLLETSIKGGSAIIQGREWEPWEEVLTECAQEKGIDISTAWPSIHESPVPWMMYAEALADPEWIQRSSDRISELVN